ncbi:hypothetical protein OEZ86_001161 [Tetradesmus obliquus]|nr:hypothetical protein OEZ86_001161 [Tetradesmus obliquus]
MLRGWPTSTAVAMSNVTVLGGSFANFICNVSRRRSNGAPTVDWELILMMEPTTIAGALFGAMLNKLLPNYVTTYLLTAMLSFMAGLAADSEAAQDALDGVAAWLPGMLQSDDTARLANLADVSTLCQGDTLGDNRDVAGSYTSSVPLKAAGGSAISAVSHPDQPAKAAQREPCLPLPHLLALLLLSGWVVASDIAQGSVRCGSWRYWAVTLSVLAPIAVILLVFRRILLRKYNHDDLAPGHVLPEGQLHWTATTTLLYPAICSSAGLVAGLFGIGGGVVKGPLMLELGVPPDVAAATSATMIMFTAGSACVVYSRFGQILADYGAILVAFGFCTTLCSQLLTFALIKMIGRRSVIVFMMVTLMSIACGIMYVQSGLVTRELLQNPGELGRFGRLCPEGEPKGLGQLLRRVLAP